MPVPVPIFHKPRSESETGVSFVTMKANVAERVRSTPPKRRLSLRYPAHPGTTCRVTLHVGGTEQPGQIRNISRGGISLELAEEVSQGSLLALELCNAERSFSKLVILRALRVRQKDDGMWQVAGVLVQPLSPEALKAFIYR
jgi:hypothetical protein